LRWPWVAPADALAFLQANASRWRTGAALDADHTWRWLRACADAKIAGGQTYDALIAECALLERATTIVTLNARHFRPFEHRGLAVREV